MKKIGTITTAIGFIFYGIWIFLSRINCDLSQEIIKFWPILFVLLGIEFLYAGNMEKRRGRQNKVNYLIVLVIIIFSLTDVHMWAKDDIKFNNEKNINIQDKYKDYFKNNFNTNMKKRKSPQEIKAKKELESYGKEIKLDLPNSNIKVKNSKNGNIILDLKVYVNKTQLNKKYKIHEEKLDEGYKINFPESYVNEVKGVVYVPEGLYVKINGANLKVEGEKFIGDIDIDGSNCDINLHGDIKRSIIDISSGKVQLNNKVCKDIKIHGLQSKVAVKTEDKDFKATLQIGNGTCKFNEDKNVNSGFSKVVGNGNGKLNVNVDNGTINIKSGN